jgi:hypothetical protein
MVMIDANPRTVFWIFEVLVLAFLSLHSTYILVFICLLTAVKSVPLHSCTVAGESAHDTYKHTS